MSFRWTYIFVDVCLYLTVLVFLLAIYKNLIPPAPGYFNCDDLTIALPYKGDTFSTKILIVISSATVLVLVSINEFCRVFSSNIPAAAKLSSKNTGKIFLLFWLSFTWNVCLNLVIKTLSAVPRPHFISTCRPDWNLINCSQYQGNVAFDISQCQAAAEDQDEVFDAMKSFPSGHAQVACFTATFLIIYLQLRLKPTQSMLLKFWLQLGLVLMAATSSISRITDNRHHAADVWVGAALGILMAVLGWTELANIEEAEGAAPDCRQSDLTGPHKEKKEKRQSKIRLLNSSFGVSNPGAPGTVVVMTENDVKDVNQDAAC